MAFTSDTIAPCHPAIMAALVEANTGQVGSYGADAITRRLEGRIADLFETRCWTFLVSTGTAANALALSAMTPPWGAVFAHEHAHVHADEGGAPEFFGGGMKLLTLPGAHGRINPDDLAQAFCRYPRDFVHGAQPRAVTITQATESGTAYSVSQIGQIGEIARTHGAGLHMDGARFANALVHLGCTPADITWRAGIDVLSFGMSKGGALACEAIVCFNERYAEALPHLRKRSGHLLAKHRLLAAQADAFLADDLWLSLARHANGMAQRLAGVVEAAGGHLVHPVEANEVFVRLSPAQMDRMQAFGLGFYVWGADGVVDGRACVRLVTSWSTQEDEIARLATALGSSGQALT